MNSLCCISHSYCCNLDVAAVLPEKKPSLFTKIHDSYIRSIQSLSQSLYHKGWIIPHYIVGSLFAEPKATISLSMRSLFEWKPSWEKKGFYDAGNVESLKKLAITLQNEAQTTNGKKPAIPVILFHSVHSSPHLWQPCLQELKNGEANGLIGHVITLQLPDEMEARMRVARKAIHDVAEIYNQAYGRSDSQVDLIGHSKGGYAAHIAAFATEKIYEDKTERRWHSTDQRNPEVRKVISLAAPTWLCCHGEQEEGNKDIYPKNGFTAEQIATIQSKTHEDIFDFIATQDAISPTKTPLPIHQVSYFKYGHLGIVCPEVFKAAISTLNS